MKKRVQLIDELRGLAIILMIIYHFIYQYVLWMSSNSKILDNIIIEGIRLGAEFLFITISGISSSFSRNNFRRGLICVYLGIFITVVTYIFVPRELISFGILHFLGISIIFYELLIDRIRKITPNRGLVLSLILFIVTYVVLYEGSYLKERMKLSWIINLKNNGYLNFIGIKSNSFISSDFFPIIPWFFLFLSGGFIGEKIKKIDKIKDGNKIEFLIFLRWLGRNSLLIYMTHIPIIIGIIFFIKYIVL
ncbi:heparan-alpha-glucosaminide N-acetyltransferase domain-containing protein [Clostridium sp. HBUAS56017]|uniref:heparan-alpha-glucosaminide N-acetyltransferase domain-containing protein n=1 Tax=Clostridium sp. HBUAS56017 TaxID=2571128 RepID=UPI0011775FF5|nr:heparan-alpha-glucosaminide N-acetyltransferase domain-containing protein [Clostridium sp. HBUAS56017]